MTPSLPRQDRILGLLRWRAVCDHAQRGRRGGDRIGGRRRTRPRPAHVDGEAEGDRLDPRAEAAVLLALVDPLERTHEGRLGDLLGVVPVAEASGARPEDRVVVALVQDGERVLVAGLDGGDQIRIGPSVRVGR
jgi:hypothetical protein